jgi:hypothetical protein
MSRCPNGKPQFTGRGVQLSSTDNLSGMTGSNSCSGRYDSAHSIARSLASLPDEFISNT